MATCPYCGNQVADGAICACRYQQQQQPQQQYGQQPPQQYGQPPPQQYGQPPQQYGQPVPGQYGGAYVKPVLPGKAMIRVTGILLTIFGAIAVISVASALIAISSTYLSYVVSTGQLLLSLLSSLITLCIGILATAWAPKKEKANVLFIVGIILLALHVIDLIMTIATPGMFTGFAIFTGLLGLVLPILLVVGANTRKNAPQ